MRLSIASLVLTVLPVIAGAHHSNAEYDRNAIQEIEGELTEVIWRNPHVRFTVRAPDADGQLHDWELETSTVYVLGRLGLDGSRFPESGTVRAAGWASRVRPAMRVTNMLLPDGTEVLLAGADGNRWSDEYAGELVNASANRAERDIFRIWSAENPGTFGQTIEQSEIQLTDSAQANMDSGVEFDPCVPQGMPTLMYNPLPIEFVERGDTIELRMTAFGVVRTIYMTDGMDDTMIAPSDLGYSVGRRVGDTLEVRTTRISWPYFDDNGTPQTSNVQMLERFSLIDDKSRLTYHLTVIDPESFVEPIMASWEWVDIGEETLGINRCEQ
jgi:hypothetical protein